MSAPAKLRLLTGGDLLVADDTDLAAPRPRALFVLLALDAGQAVSRDRLCDFLWPYTDQSTARQRLRMALLNMKRGLSEDLRARLRTRADSIALDIDPAAVDALRFTALVNQETPEALSEAVALYGGDLLGQMPPISDVFDRMLGEKRDACRSSFLYVLHDIMRLQTETGDRSGFERTYRRALEADGANDETAMLAMAASAADRQAQHVQEVYDTYAANVEKTYGSDPPDAMRAARDTFLAEADRPSTATASPAKTDTPAEGFAELRAKPRVALRRSGRRIRIAAAAIAILFIVLLVSGAYLWSRTIRLDASEGEVFLFRPIDPVIGECETDGKLNMVEQTLLDALQRFEGSNTILGSMRRRLIGSGPGIFEVALSVACLDGETRATVTVINTENRSIIWVGRYQTDRADTRDLSDRIYRELLPNIRP
jgi:DNA-binding SARP family transcriptional activator